MQTVEAIILVGSIDTKRLNWFIFSQKTLSSPPMHIQTKMRWQVSEDTERACQR